MKTTLIITSLFLFGAGYAVVSLTDKIPSTTEITVLRDITERHLAQPDENEIIPLFNLSGDEKWNGAVFRFANVTDVSYNQTKAAEIKPANQWLSNELDREREVKQFKKTVAEILDRAKEDTIGRHHSSVYFPIATKINLLSKSKAERRILLVYSDLMENDVDLSLYASEEFRMLSENPDSLKLAFEKRQTLAELTGIEVHFIYSPLDAQFDNEWRVVSSFYKQILEEKGANVFIEANLSK